MTWIETMGMTDTQFVGSILFFIALLGAVVWGILHRKKPERKVIL